MKIIDPLSTTNQSRDIVAVLHGMAGQEGNDGEPWDQLQQAADYITFLRAKLKRLKKKAKKQRMTIALLRRSAADAKSGINDDSWHDCAN